MRYASGISTPVRYDEIVALLESAVVGGGSRAHDDGDAVGDPVHEPGPAGGILGPVEKQRTGRKRSGQDGQESNDAETHGAIFHERTSLLGGFAVNRIRRPFTKSSARRLRFEAIDDQVLKLLALILN